MGRPATTLRDMLIASKEAGYIVSAAKGDMPTSRRFSNMTGGTC